MTSDLSFSQVTSVDKREPRGTFLSLGLFISRPRPTTSASKMRPRLRKTFPRFSFVYFGNLGKTQIRGQKFFSDVPQKKTEQNTILNTLFLNDHRTTKIQEILHCQHWKWNKIMWWMKLLTFLASFKVFWENFVFKKLQC